FLHPSCDLSFLFSFPTRRSSDLVTYVAGTFGNPYLVLFQNPIYRQSVLVSPGRRAFAHPKHANEKPDGLNPRQDEPIISTFPRRDRKSTRLNSSHEWISYAVVCL